MQMMGGEREATISRCQWIGFFALCLLSASAWLVGNAFASELPGGLREGIHDLLIAMVLCAVGGRAIARSHLGARRRMTLALASVLLLGVPAMLAGIPLGSVSEVTIAALFAMLPVAVVVLVSALGGGSETGTAARLLAPALIGLGGILLLLPAVVPASWREIGWQAVVVLAVLVAAGASVWMNRMLRGIAVVEAATICCAANAAFFFAAFTAASFIARDGEPSAWSVAWSWRMVAIEVGTAVLFELPQVVLLLWLMRDIAPERFASRYLVIPLFTVVEGLVLLRPELTLRTAAGALLMMFAAWRLLTASRRAEEPVLALR